MAAKGLGKGIPIGKSTVYYKDKPDAVEKQPNKYIKRARPNTAEVVSKVKKEVLQGKTTNPDVALISAQELNRMKQEAQILTAAEKQALKKISSEQEQQQQAKFQSRKQRMLELESEKKKLAPQLSDLEQEDIEKRDALRRKAKEVADENRDEIKHMNTIINVAKCATVREKQIEEKKRILLMQIEEEKRKDLMMEVERLKKIDQAEKEVVAKKIEVRKGREVITEQIKDREYQRLKVREETAKEGN